MKLNQPGGQPDHFPNPKETIPPSNAHEAFGDLFRDLGRGNREKAIKVIEGVDIGKVVLALQGKTVGAPLTGFELQVGNIILSCVKRGLLKTPIEAVGIFESIRQDVKDGGVFIGEEEKKE